MNQKQLPSNRKFGFLFSIIFFAASAYSFFYHGFQLKVYAGIAIGVFFLVASINNSKLLTPLNKCWFNLGLILGNIVSPLVLGFIFFLLITPIAITSRLFGRDELKLKRPESTTYWASPVGSNSDPDMFKNQF